MLTKDEAVEAAAKYLAAVQQAICQVGYANSLPIENWQLVALRGVRVLPAAQAGNTTTTDHETGQLVSKGAQVRAFLEQAYRLSRDEKIQDGIDLILGQIDEWLLAARFDLCEGALAQVDMSRLQADMVFSFVTSTLAAKHLLPKYRPRCFTEARKRLTQLRGEAFANQLLARYE